MDKNQKNKEKEKRLADALKANLQRRKAPDKKGQK